MGNLKTTIALLCAVSIAGETVNANPNVVTYNCSDVVLTGKLTNWRDYEHFDIPDDILGHGWMTATLRVSKILKGQNADSKITVRYFGHTYLRDNTKFLFVLKPLSDGRYRIISQRMTKQKPKLADTCESAQQEQFVTN
ncbi:MAG: hypothetical protein ABL928_05235 [Sphingorhabdus sp.]